MTKPKRSMRSANTTSQGLGISHSKFVAKIEIRAIDEVHPNPRNARTHSKKQVRQIARSINQFGFLNPIMIDEASMALAGHGRLAAARLLGKTQVPVVVISHLSEAEKRAYVLMDNKLAENSGWDRELLAIELGELAVLLPEVSPDLDISIIGFPTGELDSLHFDHGADHRDPADAIEAPTDRPVMLRSGDLWLLGKSRVLCGDARSSNDLARLTGGAS